MEHIKSNSDLEKIMQEQQKESEKEEWRGDCIVVLINTPYIKAMITKRVVLAKNKMIRQLFYLYIGI